MVYWYRWERRGQAGGGRGRREDPTAGGRGRREDPAAGGRWKHDMFEQLEKEEQEVEAEVGMDNTRLAIDEACYNYYYDFT